MTAAVTLSDNSRWLENEHDILQNMTAFFVDGLKPCKNPMEGTRKWESEGLDKTDAAKIFRLPLHVHLCNCQENKFKKNSRSNDLKIRRRTSSNAAQNMMVRRLIGWISHNFNNLLMGIWGNATLIRIQLDPNDPRYAHVEQMERLIQSGAFLTHMILGYLAERRTAAKQLRLNQLIVEIKNGTSFSVGIDDGMNFEARLKWASRIQQPHMIASSTACVLEVLFKRIKKKCKELKMLNKEEVEIDNKLLKIDFLIKRAFETTDNLRVYALDSSKLL